MGSRAVLLACRDEETAQARFGVPDGMPGAVYTRTGRPFFGPGRSPAGEQSGPAAGREQTPARRGSCWTRCAPGSARPGSGTSWAPDGCCSTAS